MPVIRANRDSVDDRFSVLGFTISTESPLFEVGVATDPELFKAENRSRRNRRNFFSSRTGGALRARRGEAVYLLPPEVIANFVGQQKLYFGLATYPEDSRGRPNFVQNPSVGSMYVNIAGLTPRGLRRLVGRPGADGGAANESLDWGGDALTAATPQPAAPPVSPPSPTVGPTSPPAASQAYDDGFGPMAMSAADDDHGIDGPIPDTAPIASQQAYAFSTLAPEYPQAVAFLPAAPQNYKAGTGRRQINRVVIHITDQPTNNDSAINTFQNPASGVSAHYVVRQNGEVVQMVRHDDIAWHARSANSDSIGIEHVANTRGMRPTPQQYCASAALVRWLCDTYGIPIDRQHILGHSEADPRTTHTGCPNAVWDWSYFMGMVTSGSCYEPPAQSQSLGLAQYRRAVARAQEIIQPFYDPADPTSALQCQANAFSPSREEWFAGVPNTRIFPHSAICLLEMKNASGAVAGYGTGFYIGPNRILTCGHNLRGKASVDIIPGCNDTSEPFGRFNVSSASWRIPDSYDGGGDFDLAVIDNVPNAAPGGRWFDVLEELNQSRPEGVVVCGYSRKSDRVPGLTDLMNGRMQHLHAGYIAQLRGEVFDYPILTLHRASGSPVYYLTVRNGVPVAVVVGVHISGELATTQELNTGCRLTDRKIGWIEGRAATLSLGARALEIPLDPGTGGRSIGTAALSPGDIIVSTARHPVSYAIRLGTVSAVSHAMLYVGDGNVVEAVRQGVREVPLADAIGDAILAVAYRDSRIDAAKAALMVQFAREQVGKPYDFGGVGRIGYRILHPIRGRILDAIREGLGVDQDTASSFYCSELVFAAYEAAGIPLVASRPDQSTPDDIVQLSRGVVLSYVGHLKAEDVFAGIALGLAYDGGRQVPRSARALENEPFSIFWDDVPYVAQTTPNSCWAAAAAMVAGWYRRQSIPDTEIAAKVPIVDAIRRRLPARDRQKLAEAWDLVDEPPASYTVRAWGDMLANYGPLWVATLKSTAGGGHIRVVIGMESDGNPDGSGTTMYLHDPSSGSGGRVKMPFGDFLRLYEGRVENSGDYIQMQILHAPDAIGRASTTVAPFSLTLSVEEARRRAGGGRPLGRAQADQSVNIDYPVPLIPQPDKRSCWAASMTMLFAFRRQASYTPETLAEEVGRSLMQSYSWDLLKAVRQRYRFEEITVPSNASLYFSAAQWEQWLRDYGPLWVVIVGMPHAVVLGGIRGDTSDSSSVEVKILNPWDVRVTFDNDPVAFHPANQGYESWQSFDQFASDFGNMSQSDYGNWRILHLPAAAVASQGLSMATGNGSRWASPPPPVRAFAADDEGPIQPPRVPGTTMFWRRGAGARVAWKLDQLEGLKYPDPAPAVAATAVDSTIVLDGWPRFGQDPVPLPLTVTFGATGSAVGNVRIVPGTPAALDYDVEVAATIDDDPPAVPGATPAIAAIRVRVEYRFHGTPEGDRAGVIEMRLYGNGKSDQDHRWL